MRRRAAVLGATGIVGQRLVSILSRHPWFELVAVTASEKSSGKKYGEAVNWVIEDPIPESVKDLVLQQSLTDDVDIVFSALSADVAAEVEVNLARKGYFVVSNASNMRLDSTIPLLNPEVNAGHIEVLELQRKLYEWEGAILKVPNCVTAILTLALKPIFDEFGVDLVVVSTMQAISGAGLSGLPAMSIQDNIIPHIEGEEAKVENETRKIFGKLEQRGIVQCGINVTASCHRVPVLEGHSIAVFARLMKNTDPDEVIRAIESFKTNEIRNFGLPTAPKKPIIVRREVDRPQPRLDRKEGMAVVVGRIREDRALGGIKFFALGHNTIRGAAGTAVLIAELAVAKNLL
ncbi:MAG: aspartate-semialdehyde dehydrogenase [Thermoproteota archaeon]|uniref:Aspartate-semialdehyde dehydrogenase n=1 Tax=Candidatus Methanodesulfokora washburnensis TaxID=2478471 RepID=A0A520KQ94_9CREN|nr:MAG: aspartate-semialdehyde dehydrogenase [Candidatus Methanodesulfokores washburnensis]TDA40765.1 MAG: aspartate-semialdehyde dehydrogenase [Candidatus Korarchaeota archaeon]